MTDYPKTLAAVEREASTKVERMFGIGDALVAEVGKPLPSDHTNDGSGAKFEKAAEELAAKGYDYSPDYLRKIRKTAAAYPKAERWNGVAWTVFFELRDKRELFDDLASVLDGKRPSTISSEAQQEIRKTGRVTVDAMRLATRGVKNGGAKNRLTKKERQEVAQEVMEEEPESIPDETLRGATQERTKRMMKRRQEEREEFLDTLSPEERAEEDETDEALETLGALVDVMMEDSQKSVSDIKGSIPLQRVERAASNAVAAALLARKHGFNADEEERVHAATARFRQVADMLDMVLEGGEVSDNDQQWLESLGIAH